MALRSLWEIGFGISKFVKLVARYGFLFFTIFFVGYKYSLTTKVYFNEKPF